MKRALTILAIALLLFLGFGGIYGGGMLISDPDGSDIGFPIELLLNPDFFLPLMHYTSYAIGILLTAIGVMLIPKR